MLKLEDFKQITLADQPIFQKHYTYFYPPHSDYVFTTMICWQDYIRYYYTQLNDSIVIMTMRNNSRYFRPPIGETSKEDIQKVMQLAFDKGSETPFGMIPENLKNYIQQAFPAADFLSHRDYYDYVYKTRDLVDLSGSKYSSIRNRLNKFTRKNIYTVEEITKENFIEVKEFLKRWCLWKDCESDELLEHERKAIFFAIGHYYELELQGLIVKINDQIEALSVFEQITPDTLLVHFEKGSPDYDGIYKLINWETAKYVQNTIPYINREGDMGIPGLRKAKLSYRPHHFSSVYHFSKKNLKTILT